MALARLITRTPEYAQKLRRSLETAGYTVEFAEPEGTFTTPADLQVDLDDPTAASSYIVTADGKEICFAYDELEREFVLAPLWRTLVSVVRPVVEHIQAHRAREPEVAVPKAGATPVTTFRPVEPATKSLYMPEPMDAPPAPEPVHVSGEEYFDGRGVRKIAPEIVPLISGPMAPVKEPLARVVSEPVAPRPVEAAPQEPATPFLIVLAQRAEVVRARMAESWRRQRAVIVAQPQKLRGYDAAWLRAAPVAAMLAVGFLLGWSLAGSDRKPLEPKAASPVALSGPNVKEAAIVPLPQPKAVRMAEPKPLAPQKKRRVRVDDEDAKDYADDVVVIRRHYPSKGMRAGNQSGGVRRYSDVD